LNLDAELRRNTPVQVEAAKQQYEQAQASRPPSDPPFFPRAARAPSSPDVREMGEAATKLTESVDKVCEALVMVFGQIRDVSDEGHGQTLMLRNVLRWIMFTGIVQAVVCCVMVYIAFNSVETAKVMKQTHAGQAQVTKDLGFLTDKVSRVSKQTDATGEILAEVKKAADESATVELVPDPKKPGSAVVRIVPPKNPAGPEVSPKTPPTPASSAVEIPIKVEEARTPKPDASRR